MVLRFGFYSGDIFFLSFHLAWSSIHTWLCLFIGFPYAHVSAPSVSIHWTRLCPYTFRLLVLNILCVSLMCCMILLWFYRALCMLLIICFHIIKVDIPSPWPFTVCCFLLFAWCHEWVWWWWLQYILSQDQNDDTKSIRNGKRCLCGWPQSAEALRQLVILLEYPFFRTRLSESVDVLCA